MLPNRFVGADTGHHVLGCAPWRGCRSTQVTLGIKMNPETCYGVRCSKKEEKILMHRVNDYLAKLDRTTSKAKQPNMLERYIPFVIKHFYWNLNKDTGTWFDIYPNEDVNGKFFFPGQKDLAWLMRVRIDLKSWPAATQEKAESFIAGLLAAIQFEVLVLNEGNVL